MVRIRLTRIGSKRQPAYRIIVTDGRKARDSRYLEVIGHYNPRTRPATEVFEEDRMLYWLSVGAQPSEAVEGMLKRAGTLERFQRLQAGEDIEVLLKEAEESRTEMPDPRTEYPAPAAGESKQKAREAARLMAEEAAAAAAAEAEAAAAAEAEETEAESEPEADEG